DADVEHDPVRPDRPIGDLVADNHVPFVVVGDADELAFERHELGHARLRYLDRRLLALRLQSTDSSPRSNQTEETERQRSCGSHKASQRRVTRRTSRSMPVSITRTVTNANKRVQIRTSSVRILRNPEELQTDVAGKQGARLPAKSGEKPCPN